MLAPPLRPAASLAAGFLCVCCVCVRAFDADTAPLAGLALAACSLQAADGDGGDRVHPLRCQCHQPDIVCRCMHFAAIPLSRPCGMWCMKLRWLAAPAPLSTPRRSHACSMAPTRYQTRELPDRVSYTCIAECIAPSPENPNAVPPDFCAVES
eukprot:7053938-Prymnesium_polylepis.2